LEIVFPVIMDQITELANNGITINGKRFTLEFVFCSEWKFFALLIGILAANSIWFCPWCMCSKGYRQNLEMDWSKYPRKWDCANRCYNCDKKPPCKDRNHGWNRNRNCLLKAPFTPETCVLDNLHGELRSSEVMEKLIFGLADSHELSKKLEEMCY
jgi:hypothetical protein